MNMPSSLLDILEVGAARAAETPRGLKQGNPSEGSSSSDSQPVLEQAEERALRPAPGPCFQRHALPSGRSRDGECAGSIDTMLVPLGSAVRETVRLCGRGNTTWLHSGGPESPYSAIRLVGMRREAGLVSSSHVGEKQSQLSSLGRCSVRGCRLTWRSPCCSIPDPRFGMGPLPPSDQILGNTPHTNTPHSPHPHLSMEKIWERKSVGCSEPKPAQSVRFTNKDPVSPPQQPTTLGTH